MRQLIETIINNAKTSGIQFDADLSNLIGHMIAFRFEACYFQNPIIGLEAIAFNPIEVKTDYSNPYFVKVLFHELGHATGHKSRLNRIGVQLGQIKPTGAAQIEELIAERIAQLCLERFGIDCAYTRNRTNQYISAFYHVLNLSEFEAYQVEAEAKKGFEYILTHWIKSDIVEQAS